MPLATSSETAPPTRAANATQPAQPRPHASPNRAADKRRERRRAPATTRVSRATPFSGRRMKSRCSRLSATVAWTSTPVNNVSSGVETTSRVPSARGADEHELVLEGVRSASAVQHVDRRDVRKRALDASIAQQQIALAVERAQCDVAAEGSTLVRSSVRRIVRKDQQRRGVHVGDAQGHASPAPVAAVTAASAKRTDTRDHRARSTRGTRRRRPSGSGRGVQKAGSAGGRREHRQAADGTRRAEEGRFGVLIVAVG